MADPVQRTAEDPIHIRGGRAAPDRPRLSVRVPSGGRRPWIQGLTIFAILAAYWLAFYLHPLPPPSFDYSTVGLPADWPLYTGAFAHWNKSVNFATDFDRWFLNLFPRIEPYRFTSSGLQTLNFIPSIATLAFGVMIGELLRSQRALRGKLERIVFSGVALLMSGWLAGRTICPIVKAIWTPSWVLFSAGWVLLLLAAFFWLVDVRGHRRLAFPLVVVGMNSIAMYCMHQLLEPWIYATVTTHLDDISWILNNGLTFLTLWLICFWMYRRRLFLKI